MAQFLRHIKDELLDFPRNPRKYPRLRIKKLETRPQVGVKTLMYRAVVEGETDNYITSIQFYDIEFVKNKDADHKIPCKAGSTLVFTESVSVKKKQCLLKCSCPDFRFVWEKPLYDEGALIGNWRKYTRKTPPPPAGRPYANPDDKLGYCKHVNSLLLALKDAGFVRS